MDKNWPTMLLLASTTILALACVDVVAHPAGAVHPPPLGRADRPAGRTEMVRLRCKFIPWGRGPGGSHLFFENCWWYQRQCYVRGRRTTQYKCLSCPGLSARTCPPGHKVWR
jgi:hypothetical protein